MRIRVPLFAYTVAALAGAASFVCLALLFRSEPTSTILYAMIALTIGGGLVAAPLAAPTIILTERRRSGPLWVFLAVGLVTGFAILGVVTFAVGWTSRILALIPVPTTAASLTYWLVAWYWLAPKDTVDAEREVFE